MTTTTKTPSTPTLTGLQTYLAKFAWWVDARGNQRKLTATTLAPAKAERRLPILVVARDGYQERWEQFSIRSERELKRVLTLRDAGQPVQHYIGKLHNGQRQVLTVRWHDVVLATVRNAYVAFPESLVLAAAVDAGLTHVQQSGSSYFLLKQSGGHWQSLPASGLVATSDRALLALGGSAATPQQRLDSDAWRLALLTGLQKVGLDAWQQSWQSQHADTSNADNFPWRPTWVGVGVLTIVYGLLSTGYLVMATESAEHRLESIRSDLDTALSAQATVNNAQQTLTGLAQHQSNIAAVDQFWQSIADSQTLNILVNSAVSDYSSVTLAAEGVGATNVLTELLQRDYVDSADFTAPVRSQPNGLERFTIEIQLQPTLDADVPESETQP
ncbi:MAG TPA: hypothetical protein VFM61_04300 [Pseudidiomarina sp.]|nr:hypothetical protein [Pseudidiomarina sp.]